MKTSFARFLLCTAATLVPSSHLFSQIIVQHTGSTDPLTEGFTLLSWNDVQLGPVTGDLGRDAWKIHSREVMEAAVYSYPLTP